MALGLGADVTLQLAGDRHLFAHATFQRIVWTDRVIGRPTCVLPHEVLFF